MTGREYVRSWPRRNGVNTPRGRSAHLDTARGGDVLVDEDVPIGQELMPGDEDVPTPRQITELRNRVCALGSLGLTILLIEDSPDDAELLRRSLHRGGFRDELNVVRTAEEAIQYLQGTAQYSDRAQFPYPMFIILDLGLPGMSGLEFLAWVRQQKLLEPAPVVVLTASPYASDVSKAYELGAKTFFAKPLGGADTDRILKLIVDYWSASRLPPDTHPSEGDGRRV